MVHEDREHVVALLHLDGVGGRAGPFEVRARPRPVVVIGVHVGGFPLRDAVDGGGGGGGGEQAFGLEVCGHGCAVGALFCVGRQRGQGLGGRGGGGEDAGISVGIGGWRRRKRLW